MKRGTNDFINVGILEYYFFSAVKMSVGFRFGTLYTKFWNGDMFFQLVIQNLFKVVKVERYLKAIN